MNVFVHGEDFLTLFLPHENLHHEGVSSSATILVILTFATLCRATSSCSRQILFGMRKMRLLAGLAVSDAALNLGLSLWLVSSFELSGIAYGSLIPALVIYVIMQNLCVIRLVDVKGRVYVMQILRSAVPVMAAMAAVGYLIRDSVPHDTWWSFAVRVALLLVPAVLILYFMILEEGERASLRQRLPFLA